MVMLVVVAKLTHRQVWHYIYDYLPYLIETVIILLPMMCVAHYVEAPIIQLLLLIVIGLGLYLGFNYLLKSKVQAEALDYFLYRFKKKKVVE